MSRLFELFTGEYVRLLLEKDIKQSVPVNNNIKQVQDCIQIEGYFIEEDDEYYYLGYDPELISVAVKKKQLVIMETADPNEEQAELLNAAVEQTDNGMN